MSSERCTRRDLLRRAGAGFGSLALASLFGREAGAEPGRWDFGRVPDEVLFGLAEKAGLKVHGRTPSITHDVVFLILDENGRLVRRVRGTDWAADEVAAWLAPSPAAR